MKIFSWNCRGLVNEGKINYLKKQVHKYDPNVIFLMETKNNSLRMEELAYSIGYTGLEMVDGKGNARGIAVFWKKGVLL